MALRAVAVAVEDQDLPPNVARDERGPSLGGRSEVLPLRLQKVVAEAAMLLRCADEIDVGLAPSIAEVATKLVPHAQADATGAALAGRPAAVFDVAAAHVHLRSLGYDNSALDGLMSLILAGDPVGGTELTPTEELEAAWLHRIWSGGSTDDLGTLLARTCVARPLDALASSTRELYAFTHAVLFASDMGRSAPVALPRDIGDVLDDAEAGLAAALDADNLDLVAELLWAWPMLRVPLSPAAAFAFEVLTIAADRWGFVPGPGFVAADHDALTGGERERYVLRTSYHATVVTGFLCAALVRAKVRPMPAAIGTAGPARTGAADSALPLLDGSRPGAGWREALGQLEPDAREELAPLLMTIALRRAASAGDIARVRSCLEVAVAYRLTGGPAVRQSVALLRRASLLAASARSDAILTV